MKNSITPGQISQNNRKLIYQYIYQNGPVSQQDIAYDLRLSRPTITAKIAELECGSRLVKGQVFLWEGAQSWHDLWDEDGVITGCSDC